MQLNMYVYYYTRNTLYNDRKKIRIQYLYIINLGLLS